ncbi:hypothetical protein H5410_016144 [Solanum commersonii]|uniref:Uncharacterized protein n=1 Tax=Solanum commersonii TaxID=4109 RepID=A0A9J5ZVS9_SOLCO|nr:hypothetical protein H5410_016144 [Solanum commersonii]
MNSNLITTMRFKPKEDQGNKSALDFEHGDIEPHKIHIPRTTCHDLVSRRLAMRYHITIWYREMKSMFGHVILR